MQVKVRASAREAKGAQLQGELKLKKAQEQAKRFYEVETRSSLHLVMP